MKEKDGNKTPRQSAKKANKLALDSKIKTQFKRKADAAKAAVAKKSQDEAAEPEEVAKKEVTFDTTVHVQGAEPEALAPEDTNYEYRDDSPRKETGESPRNDLDGNRGEGQESTNQETEGQEGAEGKSETAADSEEKKEENKDGEKQEEEKKEEEKEKEDKKSGKKGKKKGKGKPKKEEKKKVVTKPPPEMPVGEVTAGIEELRAFVCDKVQNALSIVMTDGVTEMSVDNVTPLLKSMDIDTNEEGVLDLIRDSLIDNFGVVNPIDLDQIVQKAQEAREETEMDDCLEVAFKLIDIDSDGFITQPDIYKFMLRLGEVLAEYALDDMLAAVDMDEDGKISLRDFRYFLLGRDVPSRKEIMAMAAAARKKREEEEARQKELEEQEAAEAAAADAKNAEDAATESGEEDTGKVPEEDKPAEETAPSKTEESKKEAVSDTPETTQPAQSETTTNADSQPTKRKSLFGGCVQTVIAANVFAGIAEKSTEKEAVEKPEEASSDQPKESEMPAEGVKECDTEVSNEQNVDVEIEEKPPDEVEEQDDSNDGFMNTSKDDGQCDEDSEQEDLEPVPVGLTADTLFLPPPDFADVTKAPPSPCVSPLPSPRRRPTIVGIGGLAVSPTEEDKSYAQAIHFLQEDMFKGDNEVPSRPHRKPSDGTPVEETMVHSIQDVEDYNNRLVFKLPPRRKSSCVDPSPLTQMLSGKGEKIPGSTESDEGIDLAEEEFIEQTYIVPCAAAPPMATLRISLPNNEDMNVDDVFGQTPTGGGRMSYRRLSSDDKGTKDGEMSTLSIGLLPETPRSTSRSEFSHISLASPRTDCQISEDDDENDQIVTEENFDELFPISRAAVDNSNKGEYDADSVWLTMGGSEAGSARENFGKPNFLQNREDLQVSDNAMSDDSYRESADESSSRRTPRKKNTKVLKRSLSCQRIELKELSLNNPVKVDQFSNRHKFGMIPRNVSKFLVLGKSPEMEVPKKPESMRIRIREEPEIISPSLKPRLSGRPQTAIMTSREQDVLQERRIRLMQDQGSPLLDHRRNFDMPTLSEKIDIPTGNEPSTDDLLDRVKTMERKILKRSNTSFELPSVHELNGGTSGRSEKGRAISASYHRKSGSLTLDKYNDVYSARDRKVSVVDLSKSLRKDDACKNTASLAKRHSGFKSIVPLARVVMAYQNVKKKRSQTGFYSISRQLEKSVVPFQSKSRPSSPRKSSSYSATSSARTEKKRKTKLLRKRSSSVDRLDDLVDPFVERMEEDVDTLVGDFKDPDIIPQEVVFERVRPLTAQPFIGSSGSRHVHPLTGRSVTASPQTKIMTLEIPDANKYKKNVKNVSLLSKLPIT